jgi:hypothetical protein
MFSSKLRRLTGSAASCGAMLAMSATAASAATYVAGGTLVVKPADDPTLVDDGGVVCDSVTGDGIGGACLPFPPAFLPGAVAVTDSVTGSALAFQVCVDNNGDSACTPGLDPGIRCGDFIFFSHDDAGNFFNPLGPLPPQFQPGCPGGPWRGYVVFLCEGVHASDTPHVHPASTGSATTTFGGTGFGNFCGTPALPGKRYVLR